MKKIEEKCKWDFSLLSDGEVDFEKEKEEIKKEVDKFVEKWKGADFLINSSVLKKALDDYEQLMANFGTSGSAGYFYFLKRSLNQSDSDLKAKQKKVEEFSKKQENKLRFFELRLSKLEEDRKEEFLSSKELEDYYNYLQRNFREGRHVLSQKEEKILTLKSGPAYNNWVSMVSQFLSEETRKVYTPEGEKEKSFAEISSLVRDKDKKTRDSAAKAFNDILDSNVDIAEAELNSVLENKKINDHLRNFNRPEEARLISDDVEEETVNSLIEAVTDSFNTSQEYYKLKADLFGVKQLEYHERTVPYGSIKKDYSFDRAYELIREVLADLDPEFEEIFKKFVSQGHLDLRPKKGKRDGAFCIHNLITQPVYILLNFNDKLEDVLTLIHETGHGINNELMRKEQNSLNFGVSTFTAEVASTFFEDFVTQKLMKELDDDLKLALIMNKLDRDISTIHRQIAAVNFERELHQSFRNKGHLSKKEIGSLFRAHMEAYMGDYVEQSEGSENWWVYWSHIRRFFYNYSYAGGLLISKSLQREVRKDPEFVGRVKEFLKTGTSKKPKDIFKEMGLNIDDENFWTNGLRETEQLLKEAKKLADK